MQLREVLNTETSCRDIVLFPRQQIFNVISKKAVFYYAICNVAVFYRVIYKKVISYHAVCKVLASYGKICRKAIFDQVVCKVEVSFAQFARQRLSCFVGERFLFV